MKSKDTLIARDQLLPVLFVLGRLVLLLGTIPVLQVFNQDIAVYYKTAALPGWPFFDYWVEYPPLFAFFSALFFRAFSASDIVFSFAFQLLLGLVGAGGIWLFQNLARRLYGEDGWFLRTAIFTLLLTALPYTWQYYDLIPLLLILLALNAIFQEKTVSAGLWIAAGILTKWFPALLLPLVWRFRPRRQAALITVIALGVTALVCGGLYAASPEMTRASLFSQPGRSSWQTVWAILDGNYNTGHIAYAEQHIDLAVATRQVGHSARVPSWATLLFFGGLGLWALLRVRRKDERAALSFFGATWTIFLLWSVGWSPQWVLYILPLLLLTLPERQAFSFSSAILLLTVLEWPLLFRVSPFYGTILIAPLRSLLWILYTITWLRQTRELPEKSEPLDLKNDVQVNFSR